MFCPRCGKPVPSGAAFCPACGSPVAQAAPRPPAPQPQARPAAAPRPAAAHTASGAVAADFEAQKKRNRLAMAGLGAAALLAAFFGARAFGLLRLGAASPRPGLQVRGNGTAPALQLPGDVPSSSLQLPDEVGPAAVQKGAERKRMPDDVRAWLEHLRECERRKEALASDQNAEAMVATQKLGALGGAMNLLDNDGNIDPGSDENKDASQVGRDKVLSFRPAWDQLVAFFNSKQPPLECAPIASDYNRAISEMGGSMGDIADLLNGASQDPASALKKAYAMKGKSYDQIDRYFGQASTKYVEICQKYETKPWFEIKKDIGMGGGLNLFGSMGGGLGGGMPGLGQ